MRKNLGIALALLALAGALGGVEAARHAGPAPETAAVPAAVVAIAPPAIAAPETPPPPAAPQVADLPTIEVAPHIVHAVPDDGATLEARPVTIERRDGRVVEVLPPRPAPAPRATPVAVDPALLKGAARPLTGPILSVAGRTVHLFGVRAADGRERCAAGGGAAASCAEAARTALAARLAGNAGVTCTLPSGQKGDPGFVCHDAAGVDLGALLVGEGLALVDRGSSYQYVAAEDAARTSRRGLWRYR